MMEITIIAATVLVSLDFEAADGPDGLLGGGEASADWGRHRVDDYQISDHLNAVRDGPMIKFCRRLDREAQTACKDAIDQ